MELANLIVFGTAIIGLFYSGGIMTRSLTALGRQFKLSEYTMAFILVAFATSLPELFVGVNSALRNVSLISFGNVIGSNILNITFVLGIAIIFSRGLDIDRSISSSSMLIVVVALLVPVILVIDGTLGRIDGAILLSLFYFYMIYLVRRGHSRTIVNNQEKSGDNARKVFKSMIIFLSGAVLLLLSSTFVVSYGVNLATAFAMPLFLVGILLSVGTTLPEVVFSMKSVSLKHSSMSLGNIYGSIVLNITFITGLVAVISPFSPENLTKVILSLLFTAIIVFSVYMVGLKRGKLDYPLGVALIFLAILFVITASIF